MYRINYEGFEDQASLTEKYKVAEPFPHAVIDGFLTSECVDSIVRDFPKKQSSYWHKKDSPTSKKFDSRSPAKELSLPSSIRELIWELNSFRFINFLERLTGISGLIADSTMEGGGPHLIERGGFLKIHADFSMHPYLKLQRAVNVLLYLNANWRSEWGGELELWSAKSMSLVKSITPTMNRAVIFNTDSFSLHGHPRLLECPENVDRKSIALYYYIVPAEHTKAHPTLYL